MLNPGRWLDIAIFNLKEATTIGGVSLEIGLQQLFRHDREYFFAKIGEKPYAIISVENTESVAKIIFSPKIFD
jgi:hypothetical protein